MVSLFTFFRLSLAYTLGVPYKQRTGGNEATEERENMDTKTNTAPTTRENAIEWSKWNNISRMRRGAARDAGVIELWSAFMGAKFDDGDVVNTDKAAWGIALDSVFPVTREVRVVNACPKCGGTGFIRAFAHIRGGKCFACA